MSRTLRVLTFVVTTLFVASCALAQGYFDEGPAKGAPAKTAPAAKATPAVPAVPVVPATPAAPAAATPETFVEGPVGPKGDKGDPGDVGPEGPEGDTTRADELTANAEFNARVATLWSIIATIASIIAAFVAWKKAKPGINGVNGTDGTNGTNGVNYTDARVDEDGRLKMTRDGVEVDLGLVTREPGTAVSIKEIVQAGSGDKVEVVLSDGTRHPITLPRGPQGPEGRHGDISRVAVEDDDLVIYWAGKRGRVALPLDQIVARVVAKLEEPVPAEPTPEAEAQGAEGAAEATAEAAAGA